MKENVSYEVPPSWIKMAENEAYGTVPNRMYPLPTLAHDNQLWISENEILDFIYR